MTPQKQADSWRDMLSRAKQLSVPKTVQNLAAAELGEELGYWEFLPKDTKDTSYVLNKIEEEKSVSKAKAKKPSAKKAAAKKPAAKKKAAAKKPAAKAPEPEVPVEEPQEKPKGGGRKKQFTDEVAYTLGKFRMPADEETRAEKLGARVGTIRFFIRLEMCKGGLGTVGKLREHLRENDLTFNNFDFQALIDLGIITLK